MEISILYAIQSIHNNVLDNIMKIITIIGDAGIVWLVIAFMLLLKIETRRCGILIIISMVIGFILGNIILKNVIARPRPFMVDKNIQLLIQIPKDYSFPSCHAMASFEAATIIFLHSKKWGVPSLILATLIAFSRMYLFVHYPSDILAGTILGVAVAIIVYYEYKRYERRKKQETMKERKKI